MNEDLQYIFRPHLYFKYEGETYELNNYHIYNSHNQEICTVDLTATIYANDETAYLLACKIALAAYYEGVQAGKQMLRNSIKELLEV